MPKYHQRPIQTAPFFSRSTKMPSMRRVKVFGLLIFMLVVTLLFWTSSARQQREPDSRTVGDFYQKTVLGLNKQQSTGATTGIDDDEEVAQAMSQRLKEAAKVAKDKANAKAPKPDPPSVVVGVGSAQEGVGASERGVAGRKKYAAGEAQEPVKEVTEEDNAVEAELNTILKKSPIIIFSKSYCLFSKKAKNILLSKYIFDPAPYVVELDQHKLGAGLQARLAELTSRRTVPNVLINAISIGGGDDIEEMDSSKTLIGKIKDIGGKKILDARLRPAAAEAEGESHGLR